jgi:hypothetical protein
LRWHSAALPLSRRLPSPSRNWILQEASPRKRTSSILRGRFYWFFFDAAGRQHGWLFQNGAFTQIDFPGASATRTVNINNSSVITGSFLDAAGVQHGLVDPADQLTQFDVPGSTSTNGEGINDLGTLVGSFTDAAGATHAFINGATPHSIFPAATILSRSPSTTVTTLLGCLLTRLA